MMAAEHVEPNACLDAALAYAARGWPVFPCWWPTGSGCACGDSHGGEATKWAKHPIGTAVPHGRDDATTDAEQIRTWWTRWPLANVAIATGGDSGLTVLDVDPRSEGDVSLAELEEENGEVPESPIVHTGGGGTHVYLARPDDGMHCRTHMVRGVDLKADGGYVIAPPSRHGSGRTYQWSKALHFEDVPLALPPTWLIEFANEKPAGERVQYQPHATANTDWIEAAIEPDPMLRRRFHRDSAGLTDSSPSGVDLSLASLAAHRGIDGAEIEALIRESRARVGLPWKRGSYYAATIGRALSSAQAQAASDPEYRVKGVYGVPPEDCAWPDRVSPEAFHGLAGDFVALVEPDTESDPAALLIQFLVMFGSVIGRGRYFEVEADLHYGNLFAVIVGSSSKARKGTSKGLTLARFEALDSTWSRERVQSGLSSGEGLIWAVRDTIMKRDVEADPGIDDKRLLVFEAEFASVLRQIQRDGNTLSAVVRDAWDRGALGSLTKTNPAKATGAHISIVGHVTAEELRAELTRTDAASGFGNRFLWVCAKRSKLLPEGGQLDAVDFSELHGALVQAVKFAQRPGAMRRDDAARQRWRDVYAELSEGQPGLCGAVCSRAEAQVVRLSLLYALLDRAETIQLPHLDAALAVWRYCEASAQHVFGNTVGDPVADEILRALRAAPNGLTRTEIREHFGRNRSSEEIGRALNVLSKHGRAGSNVEKRDGAGRPTERWRATTRGYAVNAINAVIPSGVAASTT